MFDGTKLLAASTSPVEWYKSCAHILFLSKVIPILIIITCQFNVNEVYGYIYYCKLVQGIAAYY